MKQSSKYLQRPITYTNPHNDECCLKNYSALFYLSAHLQYRTDIICKTIRYYLFFALLYLFFVGRILYIVIMLYVTRVILSSQANIQLIHILTFKYIEKICIYMQFLYTVESEIYFRGLLCFGKVCQHKGIIIRVSLIII